MDYRKTLNLLQTDFPLKGNLPQREPEILKPLAEGIESIETQGADAPVGDGSRGIMEGYASAIRFDGSQVQRLPIRSDCHAETAAVLK